MVLPASTFIDFSPVQSSNALSPIEVTELGMVTEVNPVQPSNAEYPIEVTELGMLTEVKPEQSENARPYRTWDSDGTGIFIIKTRIIISFISYGNACAIGILIIVYAIHIEIVGGGGDGGGCYEEQYQ